MTVANFAPIHNLSTGETYHFFPIDKDYKNKILYFKRTHEPNRSVPLHIHPYQEERFVVLEGEVNFQLSKGEFIIAKAGQVVSIPAGIAHAPLNKTSVENISIVSFTPEMNSRRFFESIAGHSKTSKTGFNGIPINPFKAIAIGSTYRDEFELAHIPPVIRKLTYFTLGNIIKKLGYTPWRNNFRSEINK